jgi:hypothetical protein
MSSPKSAKSPKATTSAKAGKAVVKSAAAPRSKAADGEVFAGEDKVNFVKAIWEGVPSKEAKTSGGSKSRVEETKKGKSGKDKPKADKAKADKAKVGKAKSGKSGSDAAPKVEILRKMSAPVRVEARQTPESDAALALVATLEAKFDAGELDVLTPEATQALVGVICRIYGANQESGNKYSLLSGRAAISGTDAMITCSALLKAVDLQVFELGMWQSWSGI